jgi:hypothetical protein
MSVRFLAHRAPDAEAVMHQQLDPRATRIGKQVAMVRPSSTKGLHNTGQ